MQIFIDTNISFITFSKPIFIFLYIYDSINIRHCLRTDLKRIIVFFEIKLLLSGKFLELEILL